MKEDQPNNMLSVAMSRKTRTLSCDNLRRLSVGNGTTGSAFSKNSSLTKEIMTRPPVYNPEDYANSLKKWLNEGHVPAAEVHSSSVMIEKEMSLRQFINTSDLLNNLKIDLELSYISFLKEFVSDPIDGIGLLLEHLKNIQNNSKGSSAIAQKRAIIEENECLQCLRNCLRIEDTVFKLISSSSGIYCIAICIMSSIISSRIMALELLTVICENSTAAHHAVAEAMFTLRLKLGEPVRFKFLVNIINGASYKLKIAGLKFINTFLKTSPNLQTQLYVQAELYQSGLTTDSYKKILDLNDEKSAIEFRKWCSMYVDVEALEKENCEKSEIIENLKDKIENLEAQIKILEAKSNLRRTGLTYNKSPGTLPDDEGISSSDLDEICIRTASNPEITNDNNSSSAVSDETKYLTGDSSEPTIEEVLNDFHDIIIDQKRLFREEKNHTHKAQTKCPKLNQYHEKRMETEIVPLIHQQPPRKNRNAYLCTSITENPFFENDRSHFYSKNQEFSTSEKIFFNFNPRLKLGGPILKNQNVKKKQIVITNSNSQQPISKPKGSLKRCETFHQFSYSKNKNPLTEFTLRKQITNSKIKINNIGERMNDEGAILIRSESIKPNSKEISTKTFFPVHKFKHLTPPEKKSTFFDKPNREFKFRSTNEYSLFNTFNDHNYILPNNHSNYLHNKNTNNKKNKEKLMDLPSGLY